MTVYIPSAMDKLTPRERQIYLLVGEGRTNEVIAATLCISVSTVRTHIDNIRRKLGIRGRGWAISPQQDERKTSQLYDGHLKNT